MKRDYALDGEFASAIARGIVATPKWYRPKIDADAIKQLRKKTDLIPLRDTALWLGMMFLSGAIAIWLWPSWWSAPFWFVYGVLYGSASDSRWHECGHKTAFKTAWMNSVVYHLASFMLIRNPVVWRASHVRHHTDTIIVGRDPEIVAMRPPDLFRIGLNLFGIVDTWSLVKSMFLHARGRLAPNETAYVNKADYGGVFLIARIWLVIYAATVALALWMGSILPLMIIGLPRLYGAWHHVMTGLWQHFWLADATGRRIRL